MLGKDEFDTALEEVIAIRGDIAGLMSNIDKLAAEVHDLNVELAKLVRGARE